MAFDRSVWRKTDEFGRICGLAVVLPAFMLTP